MGKLYRRLTVMFMSLFLTVNCYAGSPTQILSWLNSSCFKVHIRPKPCIRFHHGHIQVGIRTEYWFPVGIVEITDEPCDFGLGIFPFEQVMKPLSAVCGELPFLQSNANMNNFAYSNARYQVHVYTIPPVLIPVIKTFMMTHFLCPCLDVGIGDMIHIPKNIKAPLKKALAPVEAINGKVNSFTSGIESKVNSLVPKQIRDTVKSTSSTFAGNSGSYVNKVQQVYSKALSVAQVSPVFFSELVAPAWNVDTLSPDAYTVAPVINAVIASGGIATEGACDISSTALRKYTSKFSIAGIDPSFVCVGNWGHGYPRTGIVRTENPAVGLPLAGARFIQLFSTTIPVFPDLNIHDVKFQYASPIKTGCFYAGDPTIPFKVGDNTLNLVNYKKVLTEQGLKQVASSVWNGHKLRHRAVLIIWKHFGCCKY